MNRKNIWRTKELKVLYTNADILMNKLNKLHGRVKIEWPEMIGINEVKYKNTNNKEIMPEEFELEVDKSKFNDIPKTNSTFSSQILYLVPKFQID